MAGDHALTDQDAVGASRLLFKEPPWEANVAFYEDEVGNSSAMAYDQRIVPWYFEHWADRMVRLAAPEPSSNVADLACGTGMITRVVLGELGPTGTIAGLDLSPGMLTHAQSTIDDDRVTWHEASAGDLPLADASIDILCCHQGLQFFPDRAAALDEMLRVLRPGGRVVVAVWGPLRENPEVVALSEVIGEFLGTDVGQAMTGICGYPHLDELQTLLSERGFVDIQAEAISEMARHADVRDAMDGQLAALPIAGTIDELGTEVREQLIDRMCEVLAPFVDDTGALAIPATSNFASATKPAVA